MSPRGGTRSQRSEKASRISQACLPCQGRKIRCDGQTPACSSCVVRELDCLYPGVQKRRGPGKSKERIKSLEDRLSKMESMLLLSDPMRHDQSDPGFPSSTAAAISSPYIPSELPTLSSHTLNQEPVAGTGLTTAISIPPQATELDHQRRSSHSTLVPSLPVFEQVSHRVNAHKSGDYLQSLQRIGNSPILPQESEAILLQHSIEDLFTELPLFHIPSFQERLKQQPNRISCDSASWWGCLNAACALGIHRKTDNTSFQEVSGFAWAFFKNAYTVFAELVIQGNDLMAVQAVLAMVIFMRSSADTRTTAMLISTAMRMSQAIGLQQQARDACADTVQDEVRKRVFWIVYTLDVEMGLNSGIPSLLSDEDIELGLPLEGSIHDDGVPRLGDETPTTAFRWRAELATIQSRIRRQLYSARSMNQAGRHLLDGVLELDDALEDWRRRIPIGIRPKYDNTLEGDAVGLPVVALHLEYYNCVSMTHWAAVRFMAKLSRTDRLASEPATVPPHPQFVASETRLRSSARATVTLLNHMESRQFSDVWRILCYPFSASLTLLVSVLENPTDPESRYDSELLGNFVRFIEKWVKEECCDLTNMLRACRELERTVSTVISDVTEATKSPIESALLGRLRGEEAKTVASLISASTHPMYLAQSLMSNLANRDTGASRRLARALGVSWDEGSAYGPFVPESLIPDTYGFNFVSSSLQG